jgi:DNA invertase Pin-like site-specific DNA recombinase
MQQCWVMSDFLGYARVSTAEQTAALQEHALRAAGCSRIWSGTASGTRTDRPQLAGFDQLRVGDTLVVWRLDRLVSA